MTAQDYQNQQVTVIYLDDCTIANPLNTVSCSDAKASAKRILTNPLWVCDTFAGIFRFIGYAGFFITKPKYIESQYHKSASSANFFTGSTSIVGMAFGIVLGGIFIRAATPGPRLLTTLIFCVELFGNAGVLSGMFLGCPGSQFFGYDSIAKGFVAQGHD